jgi:hypothetical protein
LSDGRRALGSVDDRGYASLAVANLAVAEAFATNQNAIRDDVAQYIAG